MSNIDRAALLQALGHDQAAKVLRALDAHDPPPAADPEPAVSESDPPSPQGFADGLMNQVEAANSNKWTSVPLDPAGEDNH